MAVPNRVHRALADAISLHHGSVGVASCEVCQEGLLLFGGQLVGTVSHGRGRVTVQYIVVMVRVRVRVRVRASRVRAHVWGSLSSRMLRVQGAGRVRVRLGSGSNKKEKGFSPRSHACTRPHCGTNACRRSRLRAVRQCRPGFPFSGL